MARRVSSGAQALLGLLTLGPMSGYDLGQLVRDSVGHIWSESYGQIYPNLKRLEAKGLVSRTTEKNPGKPERNIYSITAGGRDHLVAWLKTDPQPEIPRNEMLLKLFFGAQVPPSVLIPYVERMVETHQALLTKFKFTEREIAKQKQYPDTPYWTMTARFGQLEIEAHLVWARETLAKFRKLDKSSQPQRQKEKTHGRSTRRSR
ncbi:MAG TPA: PadR family transcriptional regulator [Acidobacteriaceae bacterium]|jgi:DNA-binding PadR family transcriptional regulator|nr:PadR family transcriptional regulator [Acidobacteriaceae bacterium]